MEQLLAGGRSFKPAKLVKINDSLLPAMVGRAHKNGADDIFFKLGADAYVASGKGFDLEGITDGTVVNYNGRSGKVVFVDNEINTAKEGMKDMAQELKLLGKALVGAGVVAGFAWIKASRAEEMAKMERWSRITGYSALGAIAAGAVGLIVLGAGALVGAVKKPDYNSFGN